MELRSILLLLVAAIALSISSCTPVYYPPKVNVPLLRDANEAKLNVAFNTASVNVQASYALTNNFAISGGINTYQTGRNLFTGGVVHENYRLTSGQQFELLGGFFNGFGDLGAIGIYGGYGASRVSSPDVSGVLHKFILQPSIGFVSKHAEGALSLRLTDVVVDGSAGVEEYLEGRDLNSLFVEPVLSFRFGGEDLKFTTQIGFSLPIEDIAGDYIYLEGYPFIFNVGLQYRFMKGKTRNRRESINEDDPYRIRRD